MDRYGPNPRGFVSTKHDCSIHLDKRAGGWVRLAAKLLERIEAPGMLDCASAGASLNLVEVAGVEPASEDTAARRLQA